LRQGEGGTPEKGRKAVFSSTTPNSTQEGEPAPKDICCLMQSVMIDSYESAVLMNDGPLHNQKSTKLLKHSIVW
jgi:hypothetical protein